MSVYLNKCITKIHMFLLKDVNGGLKESTSNSLCQDDCACTRCSPSGPCCGHPKGSRELCDDSKMKNFKLVVVNQLNISIILI